jgi:hypothetical protein
VFCFDFFIPFEGNRLGKVADELGELNNIVALK